MDWHPECAFFPFFPLCALRNLPYLFETNKIRWERSEDLKRDQSWLWVCECSSVNRRCLQINSNLPLNQRIDVPTYLSLRCLPVSLGSWRLAKCACRKTWFRIYMCNDCNVSNSTYRGGSRVSIEEAQKKWFIAQVRNFNEVPYTFCFIRGFCGSWVKGLTSRKHMRCCMVSHDIFDEI